MIMMMMMMTLMPENKFYVVNSFSILLQMIIRLEFIHFKEYKAAGAHQIVFHFHQFYYSISNKIRKNGNDLPWTVNVKHQASNMKTFNERINEIVEWNDVK